MPGIKVKENESFENALKRFKNNAKKQVSYRKFARENILKSQV